MSRGRGARCLDDRLPPQRQMTTVNLSELTQSLQQPEAGIFIGFVFVAVAMGGFVKGITGVGLPLVAVPVMASVLGVEHAVAVMIIPSLVSNLAVILIYRAEATANWEIIFMILLGVLGVAVGAWLLTQLNKEVLFVLMAAWVGVYLLVRIFDPKAQISDRAGRTLGPVAGSLAGLFQGGTGISFPVFGPYLHARNITARKFAFNAAALLFAFAVMQLIAFSQLGLMTEARIIEGMFALIPMAIALPLGVKAARRVSKPLFDKLVVGLLLITALVLVARGAAAI